MLLTTNPHSQVLTVAIQLGLLGALALIAMWIAHLALFRGGTLIAWFGLVAGAERRGVVLQLAPVRLQPGLALRARRRHRRRDGAARRAGGGRLEDRARSATCDERAQPQDILVPISVGELMDKITILEIKSERIKNPSQLENIARELSALRAVRLGGVDRALLDELGADLKRVNAELWDVEDAIRECDARGDFGDAFIELARAVYRLNDDRARLKKAINLASGSRLVEEKSYKIVPA